MEDDIIQTELYSDVDSRLSPSWRLPARCERGGLRWPSARCRDTGGTAESWQTPDGPSIAVDIGLSLLPKYTRCDLHKIIHINYHLFSPFSLFNHCGQPTNKSSCILILSRLIMYISLQWFIPLDRWQVFPSFRVILLIDFTQFTLIGYFICYELVG